VELLTSFKVLDSTKNGIVVLVAHHLASLEPFHIIIFDSCSASYSGGFGSGTVKVFGAWVI